MKVPSIKESISSRAKPLSPLPRTQLCLNNRSTKKITLFMRQLFNSSILSKNIIFDKLAGKKFEREIDPEMNLEKFISLL